MYCVSSPGNRDNKRYAKLRGRDLVDCAPFLCFTYGMGKNLDDPQIPQSQLDRGDLKVIYAANGTVKYAERKQPQTILTYLVDLDVLTEQHQHAGITFEVWRASFLYPVTFHTNQVKEMMTEATKTLESDGLKPQQYRDLIRLMPGQSLRFIEMAVYTPATPASRISAYNVRGHYQKAFEELTEALDFIRKLNDTKTNGRSSHAQNQDTKK